ncbi:MAG: hypothetical protein IT212_07655 [Bacteroidia bacterium]|nr:hypothetical protein [Bacteroidia bacterium]
MAKKTKDSSGEVDTLAGFDNLSRADMFDVEDSRASAMSNNSSDDTSKFEPTGDKEADKILATMQNRERIATQEKAKEPEVEEEETEEDSEAEDVEKKEEQDESEEDTEEEPDAEEETKEVEKVEDKKKPADVKKGKDKKDVAPEDDDKPLTFDEADGAKAPEGQSEDNGWKDVAKQFNLDLSTDTFEEFKEKIEAKAELNISKLKPETQRLIKFTEAGGTVDDFAEPLSKVDQALILSDVDLAERHLIASGWKDEEKIANKLEQMVESGEVEVVAEQARLRLNEYRTQIKNEIIENRIKAKEKYDLQAANAPKEEAKAIKVALESRTDFLGTPLSKDNREKIAKNFESGKYHDLMKDPQAIADFALFTEYGKLGQQNLKTAAIREWKEKNKHLFHAVPPKTGKAGSVRAATSDGKSSEGNWEVLERERTQRNED